MHDTHTVESRFKHGALLGHLRSCACGLISGSEGIVNRHSSVSCSAVESWVGGDGKLRAVRVCVALALN